MMEILHFIPMVLTALYFCWSSNAHKIVRKIYKAEGLILTIIIVSLCIGCWQLFWIIRLDPPLAKELTC
jgi:DMSO/TMAO reductase YedYZ heme-binding membrane subunit